MSAAAAHGGSVDLRRGIHVDRVANGRRAAARGRNRRAACYVDAATPRHLGRRFPVKDRLVATLLNAVAAVAAVVAAANAPVTPVASPCAIRALGGLSTACP